MLKRLPALFFIIAIAVANLASIFAARPAEAGPAVTPTLIASAWAHLPAIFGLLPGPTITPLPPLPTFTPYATLTATSGSTATPRPSTDTPQPPTATNTPKPPTATHTPRPPTATHTPKPPTATNTPRPQPTATDTRQPTSEPPPSGCTICSHDVYNCDDFDRRRDAQACHDYCMAQVGYDVHRLDSDGDGEACESLPWQWWLWQGAALSSAP